LGPFVKKHHFSSRATDDHFVMVIECTSKTNVEDLKAFLSNTGAFDVNVQEAEANWWLGTYDKEQVLIKDEPTVA